MLKQQLLVNIIKSKNYINYFINCFIYIIKVIININININIDINTNKFFNFYKYYTKKID
jgi:hypothetical protein